MRILRFQYICLVMTTGMFLSNCADVVGGPSYFPQMFAVDGATVIGTGKTISDHIVSFTTGKNCSTVRKNLGQHYCEEDEVSTPDEVFCYNTLGDVSCYESPAPHGETQQSLGVLRKNSGPPR